GRDGGGRGGGRGEGGRGGDGRGRGRRGGPRERKPSRQRRPRESRPSQPRSTRAAPRRTRARRERDACDPAGEPPGDRGASPPPSVALAPGAGCEVPAADHEGRCAPPALEAHPPSLPAWGKPWWVSCRSGGSSQRWCDLGAAAAEVDECDERFGGVEAVGAVGEQSYFRVDAFEAAVGEAEPDRGEDAVAEAGEAFGQALEG